MAISKEIEAAVKAKLAMGTSIPEVGTQFPNLNYTQILNVRKKLEKEEKQDKILQLHEVHKADPVALDILVARAKDEAPLKVVKKLETIEEGLKGLALLDHEFHTTMSKVLKTANAYLDNEDLKPSEWVSITNALANAYSQIFNSKGVNVNVNNGTNISTDKLQMFKGAMRN